MRSAAPLRRALPITKLKNRIDFSKDDGQQRWGMIAFLFMVIARPKDKAKWPVPAGLIAMRSCVELRGCAPDSDPCAWGGWQVYWRVYGVLRVTSVAKRQPLRQPPGTAIR